MQEFVELKFPGDKDIAMIPSHVEKEGRLLLNDWLEKYFAEHSPSTNNQSSDEQIDDLSILYQHVQKKKKTKFSYELDLFINVSSSLTGTEFWSAHKLEFPNLFRIYTKLRCIQPTSASVERLFSTAKLVFDDLAANMDVDTLFYNLILKKNFEC